MRIDVLNRIKAVEYTYTRHKEKSIIISITEKQNHKPSFHKKDEYNNIQDILYLTFDDIIKEEEKLFPYAKCMDTQDALDIISFVDKYKDNVDLIIVHCHAGISRSAAIGSCISRYLGINDMWIWADGEMAPNPWCMQVMNNMYNLFTEDELKFRTEVNLYTAVIE